MTIPDLQKKFLQAKELELTPASNRAYVGFLRQFESCWQTLTTNDWDAFDEAVKARVALLVQSGVKPISAKAYLTVVRSMVNWSHQNGYRPDAYKRFKLKVPKLLPDFLEREEFLKLLTVPVGNSRRFRRAQLATRVFLDSGCRSSEVLGLRLADVGEFSVRVMGKGRKARMVPLLPATRALVLAFAAEFPGEFIFGTVWGRRMGTSGMLKDLKELAKKAGLERRTYVHLLRHTLASHYLNDGGSLKVLQGLLGHEDISTTSRYLAVSDNMMRIDHSKASPLLGV